MHREAYWLILKTSYTQGHAPGDILVNFEGTLYTKDMHWEAYWLILKASYTQEHEPGDILVKFEGTLYPET